METVGIACHTHALIGPRNHQVGTLEAKRHTLVPSPTPPLHSAAWFKRGRGNRLKCYRANVSARGSQSGGISRHVVCDVICLIFAKPVVAILEIEHDKGKCTLFYCCFDHDRILVYKNIGMWGMYNLAKAYSIQKSVANRRVADGEASNGHTKDTTRLFHGPWHDPVGEHICAQPFRMWNRLRFHRSHKYFKDAKAMYINRILKIS